MPRWLDRLFGRKPPLPTLREQVAEAKLKIELQGLQTMLREDSSNGLFAFDNLVDPREPLWDTGDFWYPLQGEFLPPYLDNRKRGEVLPVYLTEYGLKVIRDQSRRMLAFNEFAINAVQNRISYICGTGFKYKVVRKGKPAANAAGEEDPLCKQVQDVLDQFQCACDWGEIEQEIVLRGDRDGEAFLRWFPQADGTVEVRFVEPEHVRSWDDASPQRSFGVEADPLDIETVKGYWITANPDRSERPGFVDASEVLHIRCNTDRNAKRGLPTMLAVRKNLERADKLLRNMSTLAQVQATFALIRHHKDYSPNAVSGFQAANADVNYTEPISGRQAYFRQYLPGSIVDADEHTKYEFPSAAVEASQYVEILQAELRAVASRLIMPEYMLTSDASNANFASTLVAEAPSTRNFERWQDFYARKFGRGHYHKGRHCGAMWRVILVAVQMGRLPRNVLSECELKVEGPTLTVRDKNQDTDRFKTLNDSGVLSKTQWATEEGYDYHEQAELAKGEPKTGQQAQPPAALPPAGGETPPAAPPGSDEGGSLAGDLSTALEL